MGDRKRQFEANPWRPKAVERDYGSLPLCVFLFGLIGAAASTAAVGQVRRTISWFYTQLSRAESYASWEDVPRSPNRSSEAWSRYYRRMQEKREDGSERVERIRRMQSVFNRERSKYKGYESWNGHGPHNYQHNPRDDWYWSAEAYYTNQRTNFRSTLREPLNYSMSHHYSVLGLDRLRPQPFSDTEIKTAFRRKAKEYHPDQNQNDKGCDQNHEQVDPDALYKSFVLRVMAARSPGVRRRKAFNRGDERSIPKCPHSAPAKPRRSRITRLSTATAAAEKTAKPKLKNHPISSLRASPSQTKTTVQASSARKKALTTPRSKNPRPNQEPFLSTKYQKEPVAAARNPAVAKALFMNTPKKACEKNATPLKSQAPVSEICAKMTKLNLASRKREVPSRYLCQLSNPKTLKRGEESRTKCLKKGQESGTNTKKKLLGSLHKCTNPALGEANRNGCNELAREENPGTEAQSAKESTETTKTEIEISNDSRHDLKESRIDADTSQPDNSDNNKENVLSDDKPMDENSRLEINENVPRTVAKMQNKAFHKAFQGNQEQGGKLKRTTNPKPFRLRTDERGILKETNSERKRMLVDQHNGIVVSVHKNGDGAVGSSLTTRQKEKHLEGKGTSKVTSSDKQKKQRIRGATGELVEAKSVANGVPCSKLENTKAKVSEKSQKIPKPASSSRRTIKTARFAETLLVGSTLVFLYYQLRSFFLYSLLQFCIKEYNAVLSVRKSEESFSANLRSSSNSNSRLN